MLTSVVIVVPSIAQSGTTMSCGSGGEVAGDAVKDDTSPEELLAEVEEAANEAADNLADKNPLGKVCLLVTDSNPDMSLLVVIPKPLIEHLCYKTTRFCLSASTIMSIHFVGVAIK